MVRGSLVGFGLRFGLRLGLRLGLAWAVACAGCRGGSADDAPPCGAVATRFLDLATHDLAQAKIDEPARRAVVDQLPAMRDALAQACVDGRWRPAVRTCLVQATDHVAFEACERQLTDEQRRDLDRANRGSSAPAVPAP